MPTGACQAAFAAAAAADGIVLGRASVPWINQQGHFGLPEDARAAIPVLEGIFEALGGDPRVQAAKRKTPLPGDFLHEPTGTFVEVDEQQHFTSHRLLTLESYPATISLGYDLGQYQELCRTHAPRADRAYAHRAAVAFGPRGRPRQRAFHDALRDVVTPLMGHPPLIRVPAPEGDGVAAYRRSIDRLAHLSDR